MHDFPPLRSGRGAHPNVPPDSSDRFFVLRERLGKHRSVALDDDELRVDEVCAALKFWMSMAER